MKEAAADTRDALVNFLASAGWAGADAAPLAGDASTRSYQRLTKDGRRTVLMIAPPDAEAAACPIDATPEERRALGYNAMARLAGPNLNAFVALSKCLKAAGFSAPEIYAADPALGLALIEDLGDNLYAWIAAKEDESALYRAAIDALAALHAAAPPRPDSAGYKMLDYDALALEAETALFADWYWPLRCGGEILDNLHEEYTDIWRSILKTLSPPHCFVLRDYHAENLIWLPERKGVARVGMIDFQDALFGHAAYDVVSLLEDARRDVPPRLAEEMIAHYAARMNAGSFDSAAFKRDYAILAAQRNAKILGIFARLAKRDKKPRYLNLLPRVEDHFRRDLGRAELAPLATFCARHFPELAP